MNPDYEYFPQYFKNLKQSPIFVNADEEVLNSILQILNRETWKKGSFPYDRDKTLHNFYVIISGRLKVFQINPHTGREYSIFILSGGDIFDIVTLMDGGGHDVKTEALDDLDILYTNIDQMRHWIKAHPAINETLLPYFANKIRRLEDKAVDITLTDTLTRLAKLIIYNIDGQSHDLKLINNLSHEEIANLIGTTRAVVNRHLQELKRDGILDIDRNKLHIKDLELLKMKVKKTSM